MYALSCMPVRTSHACTGPSALLAPNTTSSRKSDTAAIAGAESGGAPLEMAEAHFFHTGSRLLVVPCRTSIWSALEWRKKVLPSFRADLRMRVQGGAAFLNARD